MAFVLLALCDGNPPAISGFPTQRANNTEIWKYLCSKSEHIVEQTIELPVCLDTMMLILRLCNACADGANINLRLCFYNICRLLSKLRKYHKISSAILKIARDPRNVILDHGLNFYDDVIKWKYFPLYWPFVRGIHRSPVNSPHKGQCRCFLWSVPQ